MSSSVNTSRISITANRGTTGALFAVAIITYVIRTYIRTRYLKQFYVEDALLSLAVISLCATTALAYMDMHYLYNGLAAILHSDNFVTLSSLLTTLPRASRLENAASMLWWCVLFPVKLAFLFFCRRLIIHWRNLYIWWWLALVLSGAAFAGSVVADWFACPYFTQAGVLSCSGSSSNHRVIRITAVTTAMDVFTDFIVLSFPVSILRQIRVNIRQKAGLGLWLCLSAVMAIVAIVRIAGIKLAGGSVDIVWLAFWQQQESSIAVIMVSMSAFRSLFVENVGSPAPRRQLKYSANDRMKRLVRRALGSEGEHHDMEKSAGLPQIPRATLTGMSETIREL